MPVIFSIGAFKVNSVNNASVFNIGQNIVIGFTNTTTNNQGTGQSFGDGIIQPHLVSTGFDASNNLGGNPTNNTPLANTGAL